VPKAPRVTVTGTGEVRVEPDRADVHFDLRAVEADRRRAHERVARRLAATRGVLDHHQVPAERRRSGPITERQLFEPNSRKSRGFEAVARLTVRLHDFERLGALIEDAVSEAEANVVGPIWAVSTGHPSRLEACRLAAVAAARRAQAYAEGAGLGLGRLRRLTETAAELAERGYTRAVSAGPAPEIELNPGTVIISARVTAVYELREEG
jgi:uncharacterized protein YggE